MTAKEFLERKRQIISAAQNWAEAGYGVKPVHSDHRPAARDTKKLAHSAEEVKKMFTEECPDGYDGFAMQLNDDTLGVDLDRHGEADGVEVFMEHCKKHGYTPNTYTEKTPRGGLHMFFKKPAGLPSLKGKIGVLPSVDSFSGLTSLHIAMAPSRRGDLSYTVEKDVPMEEAPECVLMLFTEQQEKNVATPINPQEADMNNPYARAVLNNSVSEIEHTPEGLRNITLYAKATDVYKFVAGGELSEDEATELLTEAGCSIGLTAEEVSKTLASAKAKGFDNPRQAPKRDDNSSEPIVTDSSPLVPLKVFPESTEKLILAASEKIGASPNIGAVLVLTEVGMHVGRAHMVALDDDWQEGANLYGGILADSGDGKTPMEKVFSEPRKKIETLWREEHQQALEKYNKDVKAYERWEKESSKKGFQKAQDEADEAASGLDFSCGEPIEPQKPRLRRLTMKDFTMETLPNNMVQNPKGIFFVMDEMSGLFQQRTRYNAKGDNGLFTVMLSAYNYDPITVDRVDESKNRYVPYACLGMCGLIPPDVLYGLITKDEETSGFLARYCLVYGDRIGFPNLEYQIPGKLKQDWEDVIFRLAEIDLAPDDASHPVVIQLSPEAHSLFCDASTHVGFQMVGYQGLKKSFYSKLPEKILRLANILHHLHAASNGTDFLADISVDTMKGALLLAGWLTEHFELFLERLAAARPVNKRDSSSVYTISTLGAAYWQVLSDLRPEIEANDGKVSNELIKTKVQELTHVEQTDEMYSRYMEPYTLCAVKNIRNPLTKTRGRGRKINLSSWKGVSPVSPVSSTTITDSYRRDGGETPPGGVSLSLKKLASVPSEYRV